MLESRRMPRLIAAMVVSVACGAGLGSARADQPHVQAALAHLQAAQAELQKAAADKGGNRVKALRQVSHAIASVQASIQYDRTH